MEGFVLGAYRTFQIAITDLADATGYDFSAYLAADPLAATIGGQEAVETVSRSSFRSTPKTRSSSSRGFC